MAANNVTGVQIWHSSGASNIVPDFELPYWTSELGGSWSLNPPGSAKPEEGPLEQIKAPDGTMVPVVRGNNFNERPIPPVGVPKKREDVGQFSLVYFETDPTPNDPQTGQSYWIFNAKDKTFRPVTSFQQLDNFIISRGGTGAQDALKRAINLDLASVSDPSLGWSGDFLGVNFSPQDDGTLPYYDNPNFVSDAVTNKYNSTTRDYPNESASKTEILGTLSYINMNDPDSAISPELMSRLESIDSPLLAKYISARTYGGYDLGEIWQDLRIMDLAKNDPAYAEMRAVSDTIKKSVYVNTPEYNTVAKDPNLQKPYDSIPDGGSLLNSPVGMIDTSFFEGNAEITKEEIDNIKAPFYDLLMAQTRANTEQEKAIADSNFQKYISNLNRQFRIDLSNNARTAWGQIQELAGTVTDSGLAGSGIEAEARSRILAERRRSDDIIRQENLDDKELKEREFLLNSADEKQVNEIVNRMDEEDRAAGIDPKNFRSVKWGIVPSAETLAWFDPAALAERFPDLSAKELELMRGQLLDSNNRFRSSLFQYGIGSEFSNMRKKRLFQEQEAQRLKEDEEARNRKKFEEEDFSSYVPPEELSDIEKPKDTNAPPVVTPGSTPGTTPTDPAYNRTDAVTKMLEEAERKRNNSSAVSYVPPSNAGPTRNVTPYVPPAGNAKSNMPVYKSEQDASKAMSQPSQTSAQDRMRQIKIRHTSGGEQTVMQGDYDDYWKNQQGWSRV